MDIAIVGGGILGITLGYLLSQRGTRVTVFEASDTLGGLAGPIKMDGYNIDRYYHAILTGDAHLQGLFAELGISDRYHAKITKSALYKQGRFFPVNDTKDYLTLPLISLFDRFRLGLTYLYALREHDLNKVEAVDVESWLTRVSGRKVFETFWRPLLRSKFDGSFDNTPATYIWSRIQRMATTRSGANQKEMSGYLVGGYITLLEAMARQIETKGGIIHLKTPVQEVVVHDNQLKGVRTAAALQEFDAVVVTMQTPLFTRLAPGLPADYQDFLGKLDYLGVVCPLLVLDRPLTGFWTIYITDEAIPFTGIIETTSYIDPKDVGGNHLVYLPKYTVPGSPWFKMSDDEVRETWLKYLEQMFPDFRRESIHHMLVHRERLVEPIHPLNGMSLIPSIATPVKNLYLANTGQIYPELTNGESVVHHAREAVDAVLRA
jgi:protoporphyrinogen oxidase